MLSESTISLLLGIPIGIITGLYSGVIVSRYVRFAELRNQVLRIIRAIDFIQEPHGVAIRNNQDVSTLTFIASDLMFLEHRRAGEIVSTLRAEIDEISLHAKVGRLNVSAYGQDFARWQQTARSLPPNRLVLWSLWGRL